MARITLEAWHDGESPFKIRLKDDTNLDAVMTKVQHGTPLRGVDLETKRDAVLLPQNCIYICFEED